MIGDFRTVLLLGSTKDNEKEFRHAEAELTKLGYIVMAPVLYGYENCKPWHAMLTQMCEDKCKICDMCVVVTPEHIGDATRKRIRQARNMGKPVCVFNDAIPGKLQTYEDSNPGAEKYVLVRDEDADLCLFRVKNYDARFDDELAAANAAWRGTTDEWEQSVCSALREKGYDFEVLEFDELLLELE